MQCPICDVDFENDNLLSQHIENHKKKSILNNTSEVVSQTPSIPKTTRLNTENFFGKEYFENLIQNKIKNIHDLDELIQRRTFAEQVKKIISANPFVYLPYLIDDFFAGKDNQYIHKKYFIKSGMSFNSIVQTTLKLKGRRYRKKQYENAFEMNLKISSWRDIYHNLKNNFKFFKDELLELTFRNILRSFMLLILIDFTDTGISKQDIINKTRTLSVNYDIFRFVDEPLKRLFDRSFSTEFNILSEEVLDELIMHKVLKRNKVNPELLLSTLSIDNLKKSIIKKIQYNKGSQHESFIRKEIEEEYPSLRLVPGLGLLETALFELISEKVIQYPQGRSKIFHLEKNYGIIQQNLHQFGNKNTQFYGRCVSSEEFIEELLQLKKGNFDDEDDQVTRIAGLLMAESIKLKHPNKIITEFNLTADIMDFQFRNEQLEAIAKLDLQIISSIFHCKVMLYETLTLAKYNLLKNVVPENEQVLVFTFKKIPLNVTTLLNLDKTVQVIDKDGLKMWVNIIGKIPARKKSIAKLHSDPISNMKNKMVKINTIDYESGTASVSVIPLMQEITVFIGSLEEISLVNDSMSTDLTYQTYFDFLQKVHELAPDTFDEGMFTEIINVCETHDDLIRNTHPEISYNDYRERDDPSLHNTKYIKFKHVRVEIDVNTHTSNIKCTCNHQMNEEYYHTLCKHQVAAINHLYKEGWNCSNKKDQIQVLQKHLLRFQENNMERIIITLNDMIDPDHRHFFKEYLKKHIDN